MVFYPNPLRPPSSAGKSSKMRYDGRGGGGSTGDDPVTELSIVQLALARQERTKAEYTCQLYINLHFTSLRSSVEGKCLHI